MHICCANCGLFPIKELTSRGLQIRGLWFNPNIHHEDEYQRRLNALRTLEGLWDLDVRYIDRYGFEEFRKALEGHRGIRCEICYRMRLKETAATAREMGLDGFTTTLLVSPYQKHDLILRTGREMEKEYSIPFLYEDFRPLYKKALALSRELGLYRQNYCGCVYSKEETERRKSENQSSKHTKGGALTWKQ
jgi:predicted adenine nucleotide alpha hydrolase (AANH) superfamily ATPase